MPVTNFLEHTEALSTEELHIIPLLIEGFRDKRRANAIKAPQIVQKMNERLQKSGSQYKLTQPRLRAMCNHIRTNSMLPLMATPKGYFLADNDEELQTQIKSLYERANSIIKSAKGLEALLG